MKLSQQVLTFGSLFFFSVASIASGDVTENFDSHPIGTSLFDAGFETGGYENLTVQNVGKDGTQGFEAQPDVSDIGFPHAYFQDAGALNVGDRLTVSVDVRMRNGVFTGAGGSGPTMFDVTVGNSDFSNYIIAGFGRIDQTFLPTRYGQYVSLLLEPGQSTPSVFAPVAELGLTNNQVGDWTDWLSIQLDIEKTSSTSFVATSRLLGPAGNVLKTNSLSPLNPSTLLDGAINIGFGHSRDSHLASDRLQVDNFSVTTISVPEPSGAILMAFAIGFGFVRTRSRS